MIKEEADQYNVCLVCTSVSRKAAAICGVCNAYQWNESPAAVIAAVDAAAKFVFPYTLGYAPPSTRRPEWPHPPGSGQTFRYPRKPL